MNRTQMNRESNAILKTLFQSKGIEWCESCGSFQYLTFAHKKKRRHYSTVEELSDFNEVLLLCLKCHMAIEKSPILTMRLFAQKRGMDGITNTRENG